eukprot:TRINITY_DN8500_c0_g1_i1.p1 TRINITY_DN8500_c0_g1~~TRINITY_DN8500_c0_g1_i1.p1  ORF type:complete len:104 (-),score=22.74 TRINITY_DN8500_c0_g1_i1:206-517(-)
MYQSSNVTTGTASPTTQTGQSNHRSSVNLLSETEEDSRKRKREDETWERSITRKLQDERKNLKERQEKTGAINQDLYSLFNDLQGITTEYVPHNFSSDSTVSK